MPINADLKFDWSGQDLVVSHENLASLARPHFPFLPSPFHSHIRIPEVQCASRDYRSGKLQSGSISEMCYLEHAFSVLAVLICWRTHQVHWCEPGRDTSECNVSGCGCGWSGLSLYNLISVKYKHCHPPCKLARP